MEQGLMSLPARKTHPPHVYKEPSCVGLGDNKEAEP